MKRDAMITSAPARARIGFKGPQAPQWLAGLGIAVPQSANTWLPLPGGGLVARLAWTEFLVEEDGDAPSVRQLREALGSPIAGVYPVLRADAVLELRGTQAVEVLAETCSVNFRDWPAEERQLALTSMVGVSVLVVPLPAAPAPAFRIWCDPTFGPYLRRTLAEVAGAGSASH